MEDLDTRVLRAVRRWQSAGQRVVLVTVAQTWGSSPRPPGSLMAINQTGETQGSVSGGCIEDDLIDKIRTGGIEALGTRTPTPTLLRYGISADEAHRFGLPCGGTIALVLEPVSALSRIDELLLACEQRQPMERVLDLHSGAVVLRPGPHDRPPRLDSQSLTTCLGPQARLIVIGAGDLSRFLCQMALGLGFEVIVCDPREPRLSDWDLPGVRITQEMPDDLVQRLRPDARTAVVALTHDPKLDDLALIDALQSGAFYVGAIGSRRNTAQRRERLQQHFGLTDAELARLHGPAGIYIGSKIPAEIALSIMAEVVAAKNGVALAASARIASAKAQEEAQA